MTNISDAMGYAALMSAIAKWADGEAKKARHAADETMCEAWKQLGTKNAEARIGGVKVGAMSVVTTKDEIKVTDEQAYQEWLGQLYDEGDRRVRETVTYSSSSILTDAGVVNGVVCDSATGEAIPGVEFVHGGDFKYTRLSGCKPDDVRSALVATGLTARDIIPAQEMPKWLLGSGDE